MCFGLSCNTREEPDPFDTYISEAMKLWDYRGAVLVAKHDSILHRGGYGYANAASESESTTETKFLIGSLTKSFTAIAVMQLLQEGTISLDDRLTEYLTDYPAEVGDSVTIRHLLSHTSGIKDVILVEEFRRRMLEPIAPEDIVSMFENLQLDFRPGEKYSYSSSNYVLLGLIIESVTNQSWETYIRDHICRPLNMTNTGVFDDYADRNDFATGYGTDSAGTIVEAMTIYPGNGYAAGSLASTVDDLYKLNLALFDTVLLRREYIDLMLTRQSASFGYGWIVDNFGGHKLTAHGGGTPGFVSMLQRWVDDSLCVIVLSNCSTSPVHTIANGLAAIALGERYELPQVKQPGEVDTQNLSDYEGTYSLSSGEDRAITKRGIQLLARRSTGPEYRLLPESEDRFYFAHDHMTTIEFVRDSSGTVIAHVLWQGFDADTAMKVLGRPAD